MKERRQFTPQQKVAIIKEALTTDQSIAEVCRKHSIQPHLFYQWQEKFFAGALEAFERTANGNATKEQRKIETLEKDNKRMREVIVEITAENVAFKKTFGD